MSEYSPITPYGDGTSKKDQVAEMFNRIAFRYDFLNHFLSLGIDKFWRKRALDQLPKQKPLFVLDVATGTGDLALEAIYQKDIQIIGVDISSGMLKIAQDKIIARKASGKFSVVLGDSEQLDFESNHFDAVMVAFGVRNFQNLEKGLQEIRRVLKPEGKVIVLEFSTPTMVPFKQIYHFYFTAILPYFGHILSKDAKAYDYLQKSVAQFPNGKVFTDILSKVGFINTNFKPLSLGICTLYTAYKSNDGR